MSFLSRFRRQREDESARIIRLLKTGRIAEGTILDITTGARGMTVGVFYNYELAGVQYESAHELSLEQQSRLNDYLPGSHIMVRYDPRQPVNSIVV
ncbi:MAG: DUF3592 domain-containing protein [Pyrinomonadaceae bacterium]